jgi:hypothetical protein
MVQQPLRPWVGHALTTVPGWLPVVLQSFSWSPAYWEGTEDALHIGVVAFGE